MRYNVCVPLHRCADPNFHPSPGFMWLLLVPLWEQSGCAVTPDMSLRLLGLQQTVPVADLLSFGLFHLSPVGQFFLPRAVEAQRDPANHLLALHAALVVDRQDECDVGELEQSHLEDECLFVGGVGLASADGRLTLGHLVAHGVQ